MLILNAIALIAAVAPVSIEPQFHNAGYTDTVLSNHTQIQLNHLQNPATDIASSYKGNCDRIRAINAHLQLGLSNQEIELLGAGRHLLMNQGRLNNIHQQFSRKLARQPQLRKRTARDRVGEIWFTPGGRYSSLSQDNLIAQKANNKTQSTLNLDSKDDYYSNKKTFTIADQSYEDTMTYNLPSGQCICSLDQGYDYGW
ncbi:MAG: hypothetical protein PUP92_13900 [Rhizonema sp. PD38]|nr:hypothetical protein [Rhizonema sp. PD38]